MKLALIASLFSLALAGADLRVSVVKHGHSPISFVKVNVKTPDGKLVVSQFTSSKGVAEFHLAEGKYIISVASRDLRNCTDMSQPKEPKDVCAGQLPVSLEGSNAEVSLMLQQLSFP
jgi:hypothetical protein